mmetsp:Transcript_11629/g.18931  ORF Transcript_11629/g.18931 Transcript_11629/m.18931 type:complete len:203 (+) Transcript_11629:360-968(+)|eukprot:CAMPEP_0203761292 /NCGR_PEP_ID=MMETSP0098-20131031/14408_1 /ASSEMBLY_ACC=CAM_ASM_000208 /TAXON_ID=96639 /ORGANISM=" , Strain NY0313808BC1" /LENGTH=202 /DNA_ID=CAMNT_0050655213 /DNA_START=427 /DNA_END=1035 /DNA_ORIENTATION=-
MKRSRDAKAGAGDDGAAKKSKGGGTKVVDKVVGALVSLGQPSSAQAIIKYCSREYGYDNAKQIRKTLKANIGASGKLVAITPTKFWVAGLDVPEAPVAPAVKITEKKEGSGDGVTSGEQVSINYALALASAPEKVIETGKAFKFQVGGGDVIKGMDAGVLGLKLGGKRQVFVPWQLGYGKRGSKPDIPSQADLIFTITLVKH